MIVSEYPNTPFHGEGVKFYFTTHDDSLSKLKVKFGSVAVVHVAYASEEDKREDKEAEYSVESLGYFPNKFFVKDSPLLHMAKSTKFSAGLGDVLEAFSTTDDGDLLVEVVVGAGKKSDLESTDVTNVASSVASVAVTKKLKTAVFMLSDTKEHYVELLLTNFLAHLCLDNRFKKDNKNEPFLENVVVKHKSGEGLSHLEKKVKVLAESVNMTRELVTAPPNYANPVTVSDFLKNKLTSLGLEVNILEREECQRLNMYCYLSVGQGSKFPPKFVHAVYRPEGPVTKKLVFVGKGIMFDAGGYNVKSASSLIHLMKFDMGGLSAVFGAANAVAKLKPKNVEVHFISASCENMLDSNSYRPGDVVVASNGKTVEVVNTDAEGRLTLADALVYATKLEPDYLVDLATLTGAQMVALGVKCAAFYSNDEELAGLYSKAAKLGGEVVWRMPLLKEQKEAVKSKIADLANANLKGHAGSVNAAQFLSEFVSDKKWVHVDMAGPVWDYKLERATGYGVLTIVNFTLLFS